MMIGASVEPRIHSFHAVGASADLQVDDLSLNS